MKKLLMMMTCVTTLCLYSATREEVRRLVSELFEQSAASGKPTPERDERINQLLPDLQVLEPDDAFPVYYKILEEKFDVPQYVNCIMDRFLRVDGDNLSSYGHQEALDWARKLLREKKQNQGFGIMTAVRYLIRKGDERDIEIIPPNLPSYREPLIARVAGTNLVCHPAVTFGPFNVIPSVTNTGPQGLYVEKILRQFWENLDVEARRNERLNPFESVMPAELRTMVVWFDENGNHVCNVDLAKYGLTMPTLDVPKPKVATASLPLDATTTTALSTNEPQRLEAVATSNGKEAIATLPWLYVLIPSVLCVGIVLWLIRKKK